jgi:hypothetical protein
METKEGHSMQFIRPNIIEFTSNNLRSHAFLAEAVVDGPALYIGLGWDGYGQSPTAVFEQLAQFLWRFAYPRWPFDYIRWFDVDRSPFAAADWTDEADLTIQSVELHGYAERRSWRTLGRTVRVDGCPRDDDDHVIEPGAVWGPLVHWANLPPRFQEAIRSQIIWPSRTSRRFKAAA